MARMRFNSLKSRILFLTTIPLSLLLVVFLVATLRTAGGAIHTSVARSLTDAGSVFLELLDTRRNELLTMANVTARDPRFFATFSIPEADRGEEFAPTLEGVAEDFLRITDADFIEIFDARARRVMLTSLDPEFADAPVESAPYAVHHALRGAPVTDVGRVGRHFVVAAVVPVFVSNRIEAVLRLGSCFDQEFVNEVQRLTGADVALLDASGEIASTFPQPEPSSTPGWLVDESTPLAARNRHSSVSGAIEVRHHDVDYLAVEVKIAGLDPAGSLHAYLGRELAVEMRPVMWLSVQLAIGGIVALAVTYLVAWIIARQITRPLGGVVAAAEQMRQGNYDHPIRPQGADEVAFLARSFRDTRKALRAHMLRLQNHDQMKSNFVALAGHELKTPLTVISALNEMIVDGEMGEVPDNIREATRTIQARLSDLKRLVDNILDMSRYEQGLNAFQRQTVDAREVVNQAMAARKEDMKQRELVHGLHVPDAPARVAADRDRLMQAVTHLLDNAIRFTPDGGQVQVTVKGAGGRVRIAVRDTGIGIAPDQQPWIFEKVRRESEELLGHSSGRLEFGSRGLGLGLALTKAIVEGHQGDIEVDSELGRGSTFTIVLDQVQSEVAAPAAVG